MTPSNKFHKSTLLTDLMLFVGYAYRVTVNACADNVKVKLIGTLVVRKTTAWHNATSYLPRIFVWIDIVNGFQLRIETCTIRNSEHICCCRTKHAGGARTYKPILLRPWARPLLAIGVSKAIAAVIVWKNDWMPISPSSMAPYDIVVSRWSDQWVRNDTCCCCCTVHIDDDLASRTRLILLKIGGRFNE